MIIFRSCIVIIVALLVSQTFAGTFQSHSIGQGLSVSQDFDAWSDQIVHRCEELARNLPVVAVDSLPLTSSLPPLQYSIFQDGRSVLRNILPPEQWTIKLPIVVQSDKLLLAISMLLWMYRCDDDQTTISVADHLHLDAAHEVLLGVTHDNLAEAEYAGTHRGKTSWSEQHPLSDEDDILHAIIHRLEGSAVGEGGYSGWDNAKYWSAGGPKKIEVLGTHPIHHALARFVCRNFSAFPISSLLVVDDNTPLRQYEIIAGSGQTRQVTVERKCWDPIAWIDLCQSLAEQQLPAGCTKADIVDLQVAELCLLVRWQLLQILKRPDTDLLPSSLD